MERSRYFVVELEDFKSPCKKCKDHLVEVFADAKSYFEINEQDVEKLIFNEKMKHKMLKQLQKVNPNAELVYLTETTIRELSMGLAVDSDTVILVPPKVR